MALLFQATLVEGQFRQFDDWISGANDFSDNNEENTTDIEPVDVETTVPTMDPDLIQAFGEASIATVVPTEAVEVVAREEVITMAPTVPIPLDTMMPTTPPTIATTSPTVAVTEVPQTEEPTFIPTSSPTVTTLAPTNATLAPTTPIATGTPTMAPTNGTAAPTFAPTIATEAPTTEVPSSGPSMAPTNATVAPTVPVPATEAPTSGAPTVTPETGTPTSVPSLSPSDVPSAIPSSGPTGSPTAATVSPTTPGTNATAAPTATAVNPTVAPVAPTVAPTVEDSNGNGNDQPTKIITFAPTASPTENQGTPVSDTVQNLEMTLVGLNAAMNPDAISEWQTVTEEHTVDFYSQNNQYGIANVKTTVTLVSQDLVSRRRRLGESNTARQLQASVKLKYNQEISYMTADETSDTATDVVTDPFQTQEDLENYLTALQAATPELEGVTSIEPVTAGEGSSTPAPVVPEPDEGGGIGTGALIGIVAGSVVAVGAILGVGYYVSQRGDDGGYVSTGKTPPSQLDVNQGPDEVSTLAEPHTNNRHSGVSNAMSGESNAGYGDQSVATVDYDYSKAYGGGGDTSVSSAGGTFGSRTHTDAAGGAALNGNNPLEGGSNFRGQNANVREELIDIYAPPGKLGVVIDTPDDGAPVVHAVKDSSVIADKLQVGDKLVAVDDEDVRSMTAIKVSKLISRKSANVSRKLSIIRTVVVDE